MNIKYYLLKPLKGVCVLLIGVSVVFSVSGCKDEDDDNDNTPALSAVDAEFAQKASYSNNAEITFGAQAKDKGTIALIEDYGKKMVDHHTAANNEFAPIAAKKKITVPPDLDPAHKLIQGQLNALTGTKYDSAYINVQVKDHMDTQALFENEIAKGTDADIKNFAIKNLPIIKAHYASADSIKKALKY